MRSTTWLSTLYQQYRKELFLAAWTVLRRVDLAEDAVHAAFVKLVKLPTPPADPKLYVFRCVRNAAIDQLKTYSRRREQPLPPDWDAPMAEMTPAEAESMGAIKAALEVLDAPSREVIELHLHGGLTFQEVSQLLEEPASTVASRYRRALEKLSHEVNVSHE